MNDAAHNKKKTPRAFWIPYKKKKKKKKKIFKPVTMMREIPTFSVENLIHSLPRVLNSLKNHSIFIVFSSFPQRIKKQCPNDRTGFPHQYRVINLNVF